MKKHIPWNLIRSYLKKEMTKEDETLFGEWISVPKNKHLFQQIEKLWMAVIVSSSEYQPDISFYWEKMKERMDEESKAPFVFNYKRMILYAASFFGIIWGSVYAWKTVSYQEPVAAIEMVQRPDSMLNTIQLILSEQKSVPVNGEDANVEYDRGGNIKVNSERLEVAEEPEIKKKPEFNQLVVPVGKRSSLVLADGTKVWVNSGSRVVYPVTFEKDKREIYVDGEVFLDVTENKESPFIVRTNKMNIKVLGTTFNVNAYENDAEQTVVLVSGKVNVREKIKKVERDLVPNQMFTSPETGNTSIRTIDITNYVSWKDGLYQFDRETLSVIIKRLSRYYGVEIVLENPHLSTRCTGKLYLKDDFKTIMEKLSEMFSIRYEFVEENKCIIK